MKIYRSDKVTDDLKGELISSVQMLRAVLFLFSPTRSSKTKQLLRSVHYVSFQLGRVYGHHSKASQE